jgi:phage baseplate assembly protein W
MAISENVTIHGKTIPIRPKQVVTLKSEKYMGLGYPISDNPKRGYFSRLTGDPLLKSNLKNLLRTARGERFMLPNFGCDLKEFLMEPLDEITFNEIKDTIYNSISTYLQDLIIDKIGLVPNEETSSIKITLSCRLKQEPQVSIQLSLNL